MALQSSNTFLAGEAFTAIRTNAAGWKAQAQNALTSLQAGPVASSFIISLDTQVATVVSALTQWKAVAGLDSYATGQAYPGTMSSDCNGCISAAQAIISWIVANFPTSGGFLQERTLNADGSVTPRSFTSAQTGGLQTALTNFIATIV